MFSSTTGLPVGIYYLYVEPNYFYIEVIGSLDELEIDYESFKYEKPDDQLYMFSDKYREFKFPVNRELY